MKKKLLSLVLAGAMVASTSVSAFAATPVVSVGDGNINGSADQEYSTNVKIEGNVANDQGHINSGTLSVTVATAASFRVDETGAFLGSNINVNNSGTQDIDVYAYGFTDTTPDTGITVKKKAELASENRTSVSLKVSGDLGTVHLNSDPGTKKNGLYSDEAQTTAVNEWKLATVAKSSSKNLELSGEAGKNQTTLNNPVNDNFTLVLKIKKSDGK